MKTFVVTGSNAGLGKEIYKALTLAGKEVIGIDSAPESEHVQLSMDITFEPNWSAQSLAEIFFMEIDCVINCAGVNMISSLDDLEMKDYQKVMDTNMKSVLLSTQFFLDTLRSSHGTIVNVVSNASHMPMTDSFAYNASKGALEIATRQMARELTKRYDITVFGISPNKLAGTEMSEYIDNTFPPMRGMTYDEGRKYQLNGLLTGKETEPKQIAELLAFLLQSKERHEYLSGCVLELGL